MAGIRDGDDVGPRGRRAGKSAVRRRAASGGKVKATFRLSEEARERIGIHAVKTRVDGSAVVEALVMEHLRRFRVSDMEAGGDAPPQSQSSRDGAGADAA